MSLKKKKRNCPFVTLYISASANNTRLVAAEDGNVVAWSSAGAAGFKGAKKATPHAASEAASIFVDKLRDLGVKNANLVLKGICSGRDAAIKVLAGSGITVQNVTEKTPIPHNGCRPKGKRRV